jgi:hypothetical protein
MNKRGTLILVLGLLLGAGAFFAFYYVQTAPYRQMLREPQPELAWLKKEFKLDDSEFARISQLHAEYLPQCGERCRAIEGQNQKLRTLFTQATNMTPEIQSLLLERARLRAQCEGEMMKHFLAVSRTMPPEEGKRYLEWVEQQTFLQGQGMEARHRTASEAEAPAAPQHHHSSM